MQGSINISTAIADIADDLSEIPDILSAYRKYASDYDRHLSLKGKSIAEANSEQPGWVAYYDERKIEMHKVSKFVESRVDKLKGKLWTGYQKANKHAATQKDLDYQIKSDSNYYEFYKILLEVKEVYELYCSIVNSFEQRGYALKNLTELKIASMGNDVII